MTSRERVQAALAHVEPDVVPLDLGAGGQTGMHVSSVYLLRQALGLDEPGTPVRIIEPYQMLGEIAPDLLDALGADVVGIGAPGTMFGYPLADWKPWTTFDGTPVLVPGGFNTQPEPGGDLLQYPEGDTSAPPSGRMPAGGYYFDAIIRQPPVDDATLTVEDNLEEFGPIADADLAHLRREAERVTAETDKAVYMTMPGTAFGDIALVPAVNLKHPRGIRDVEEWYVSTITRRDFVYRVFERQAEIALANLGRVHEAVGDRVDVVFLTGTDFGHQRGPFIGTQAYRDLFKPFHQALNDWIHAHTPWKTFMHSCGSVVSLIEDFIEAGFDVLNPVQCSAEGMDPEGLKSRFGGRITFWGGGVDTQHTLPFGTPEEVREEVCRRLRLFGPGGGYVFNPIHNVQARTPVANLLALYQAVAECRDLGR